MSRRRQEGVFIDANQAAGEGCSDLDYIHLLCPVQFLHTRQDSPDTLFHNLVQYS